MSVDIAELLGPAATDAMGKAGATGSVGDAAGTQPAFLQVRNLKKRYGGQVALQGVDLDVGANEIVGLIGPNGSGKSTFFDCCTGLQKRDAGTITVNGVDVSDWNIARLVRDAGLARTFQKTVVLHTLDVEENLVLAGQMTTFPSIASTFGIGRKTAARMQALRDQARALIDMTGLNHVAHMPAGNLSGGQQKLVQFASMLMTKPKLILLDEPLAGINPAMIDAVVRCIREANRTLGVAFVIIEHNTDVLMDVAQRVAVLHQGSMLMQGSPAEVMADSRVIDAYLGL